MAYCSHAKELILAVSCNVLLGCRGGWVLGLDETGVPCRIVVGRSAIHTQMN